MLGGVADGGGGQDELRLGAVEGGHPAQSAQHVGHVAAEDAPVGVGFVDDHVAEVEEEVAPAFVVGQDTHADHVGVGEEHAGLLPGQPARGGGGVAVVDRHLHLLAPSSAQAAHLVLGQGLRRVEVEGARVGIAEQTVEHGEVEAQALARTRSRW